MKLLFGLILAVCGGFIAIPEASAVILYGEDNSANQTDPGDGVPWANVGALTDSSGTVFNAGSAVYLGDRFVLTANHVDAGASKTHVTFGEGQTFAIDQTSHQQVAPDVDLKVFRLSEDPGLSDVLLYEDEFAGDDLAQAATLVGWGVGRDPNDPIESAVVDWGGTGTIAKRWGTNSTLLLSSNTSYTFGGESYDYEALQTRLESTAGSNEAAMALYDSGGALFQEIDGTWYLSGIATTVSDNGTSTFGSGPTGDLNNFVRIASYDEQIYAAIPEPATVSAFAGLGALIAALGLKRARRKR